MERLFAAISSDAQSNTRMLRPATLAAAGFVTGCLLIMAGVIISSERRQFPLTFAGISALYATSWLHRVLLLLPALLAILGWEVGRRLLMERELRAQRDFSLQMITMLGQGIVVTGADRQVQFANPAFASMLGYTPAEIVGMLPIDFADPTDLARLSEAYAGESVDTCGVAMRLRARDGSYRDVLISAAPRRQSGSGRGALAAVTDISELQALHRSLAHEHAFIHAVLETAAMLVMVLDTHGRILTFNRACQVLTGYSASEVIERPFWDLLTPPEDRATLINMFAQLSAISTPCSSQAETTWLTRTGEQRLIAWRNTTLHDPEQGGTTHIIATGIDVTDQRRIETERLHLWEELVEQAQTDSLTGLHNRRSILAHATAELQRAVPNAPLSLMLLDIDYFKTVNDSFGHLIGDATLAAMARRCKGLLRDHDGLGRYGGEEFLLVLPATTFNAAAQIAQRLRTAVAERPIDADGTPVQATISLGWATSNQPCRLEDMLEAADSCLYHSKSAGRNCAHGINLAGEQTATAPGAPPAPAQDTALPARNP